MTDPNQPGESPENPDDRQQPPPNPYGQQQPPPENPFGQQPPPPQQPQYGQPQPPQYGQQPPQYAQYGQYGQPAPAYGQAVEHPQGTTILVLGILSLVVCSPLGIAAWVMGNKALAEATAMGASNASTIKVGYILGIIATCLMILGVVIAVFVIIGTAAASSAAGY